MHVIGSRLAIVMLLVIAGPCAASGAGSPGIRDALPGTEYSAPNPVHSEAGPFSRSSIGNATGKVEFPAVVAERPARGALAKDRLASRKAPPFSAALEGDLMVAGISEDRASRVRGGPLGMILVGSGLIGLAEWGRRKIGKSSLSR